MTTTEFTERLDGLAVFFQKDVKSDTTQEWYREFGWLAPFQFDVIIREAKHDCERFPAGKYIWDQIRNHNFSRAGDEGQKVSVIATVVCKCGEAFCINKADLAREDSFFPSFEHQRLGRSKGCLACGTMYAGGLIFRQMKNDIAQMS